MDLRIEIVMPKLVYAENFMMFCFEKLLGNVRMELE